MNFPEPSTVAISYFEWHQVKILVYLDPAYYMYIAWANSIHGENIDKADAPAYI